MTVSVWVHIECEGSLGCLAYTAYRVEEEELVWGVSIYKKVRERAIGWECIDGKDICPECAIELLSEDEWYWDCYCQVMTSNHVSAECPTRYKRKIL